MALDLRDVSFFGPALPEPFVKYRLEAILGKKKLLLKTTGAEGKRLQSRWDVYRRKLRLLGDQGGDRRVCNHVIEPLMEHLGYKEMRPGEGVSTREGLEDGGWLLETKKGDATLRAWTVSVGTDLDAPNRRGRAYRFSPSRVAQRVLQAKGERVGLLTDGEELRLLICDPARPDSHIAVRLDRSGGWRASRKAPDSFRLLVALACPKGVGEVPDLTDQARLAQAAVTQKLRQQARSAVEGFVQEVLDHPQNADALAEWTDLDRTAQTLWQEGLYLVYRLLFVFKLESSADPARAFSFAATSLWRNTYSPNTALAPIVRQVLDSGADSGGMLEGGLRALFRLFAEGLTSSELKVNALGGMLFGEDATPLLDLLHWGEQAVAKLLDRLLWTPGDGKTERERVHYGALDVEDLGRVYEALLELEPGITSKPMCRLRRAKLEVVVAIEQGEPYRAEEGKKGGKTKVVWIEDIPEDRFYLRVGLGRKSSGSYYTPHAFVRFLVQETLGPQIAERSPADDPQPGDILKLKVLDPAMGSGHFLVEACRYLGHALYEACRLCDERALEAEEKAEREKDEDKRNDLFHRARAFRKRVEDLPDPDDELVAYLPSRVLEGEESGLSQRKAEALCRRLVAVHCLYGVDKNPLAVELAKVTLWLESYAEGLPLTFLDHRLICGDSLTGPFFEHLLTLPRSGEKLDRFFQQGVGERLTQTLGEALAHVRDLEATVGKDVADLEQKRAAKAHLDDALTPFEILTAAWNGGVMLGDEANDSAYAELVKAVVEDGDVDGVIASRPVLRKMIDTGKEGVAYDLVFPEVFHPEGTPQRTGGFHAVLGNPPWDALQPLAKEFFAAFDLRVLDAPTRRERAAMEERLTSDPHVRKVHDAYLDEFTTAKRIIDRLYERVGRQAGGRPSGAVTDLWQAFAERGIRLDRKDGRVGYVLPSAFHANQSATGIRELYLKEAALQHCYSFENRKKLFDIHASFKFATVVARRDDAGTEEFSCAFYLHDLEWLFAENKPMRYSLKFVERTGGEYLNFLELLNENDVDIAEICFRNGEPFGRVSESLGIRFGRELHMSDDAWRFTPTSEIIEKGDPRDYEVGHALLEAGFVPLHEGKTFWHFDDHWEDRPRYLVNLSRIAEKKEWISAIPFYRALHRKVASATNERTAVFCVVPPGVTSGESCIADVRPMRRPNSALLSLTAGANSFCFDWCARQLVGANFSGYIRDRIPLPIANCSSFFAHCFLRLCCNHAGYTPLWIEQVGEEWREPASKHTWPVVEGDDTRWAVRAAIDAVVADAYGLDRKQYEHVLSTFSHKSYPKAPELCLAAYDELREIGLEAFVKKHDPYWDVPLNENLPKPVIELPEPTKAEKLRQQDLGPLFAQHGGRHA